MTATRSLALAALVQALASDTPANAADVHGRLLAYKDSAGSWTGQQKQGQPPPSYEGLRPTFSDTTHPPSMHGCSIGPHAPNARRDTTAAPAVGPETRPAAEP